MHVHLQPVKKTCLNPYSEIKTTRKLEFDLLLGNTLMGAELAQALQYAETASATEITTRSQANNLGEVINHKNNDIRGGAKTSDETSPDYARLTSNRETQDYYVKPSNNEALV